MTTTYRPDIDGLRSIAILSVVAYHAGLPFFSGGYAGVDIFFVISGYLITSLIMKEQLEHQFSIRTFYIRRARRLFPALFVMLAVSTACSWWLLMPNEMEDFGESLATAAAFSSNLMFWSESGYFEGPAEFKPLLHTWSLAVEEQYYLLFPLLLLCCRKFDRYLVPLSLVSIASLALSEWFVTQAPSAAFFLLPHRVWELMIGSLVAVVTLKRQPISNLTHPNAIDLLSAGGLTAVAASIFGYTASTPFPGFAALLPTLGTATIILVGNHPASRLRKALSLRLFVNIGLISYSLYLWHWPVLVFAKLYLITPPNPIQTTSILTASFGLAWLSWHFIERPFRRQPKDGGLIRDSTVLPASAACIVTLIATGVFLDQTDGAPGRLPGQVVEIAKIADDKPKERKHCSGVPAQHVSLNRLCSIGNSASPPSFIVWGDSHAMTLVPIFHQIAGDFGSAGINATSNGCAALLEAWRPAADPNRECAKFNAAVLNLIESSPTIKKVILIGRWGIYAEGDRYKYESGDSLALVDTENFRKADLGDSKSNALVWQRSLNRTIERLAKLPVQITIMASIPEIGWNTPNVIARSALLGKPVEIAPTREEFDRRQQTVAPVLLALSRQTNLALEVLHPADLLCPADRCVIARGNDPLYIDEDHLSSAGADALRPLIRKALAR